MLANVLSYLLGGDVNIRDVVLLAKDWDMSDHVDWRDVSGNQTNPEQHCTFSKHHNIKCHNIVREQAVPVVLQAVAFTLWTLRDF